MRAELAALAVAILFAAGRELLSYLERRARRRGELRTREEDLPAGRG